VHHDGRHREQVADELCGASLYARVITLRRLPLFDP
jgi:hypothetical protein